MDGCEEGNAGLPAEEGAEEGGMSCPAAGEGAVKAWCNSSGATGTEKQRRVLRPMNGFNGTESYRLFDGKA